MVWLVCTPCCQRYGGSVWLHTVSDGMVVLYGYILSVMVWFVLCVVSNGMVVLDNCILSVMVWLVCALYCWYGFVQLLIVSDGMVLYSCVPTWAMCTSTSTSRRPSTSTTLTPRPCTWRPAWCSWTPPSTWSSGRSVPRAWGQFIGD